MLKQGKNPLWDYFKISNENISIAVCIRCKKDFIKRKQNPLQNDDNNKFLSKPKLWFQQNSGFSTSIVLDCTVLICILQICVANILVQASTVFKLLPIKCCII